MVDENSAERESGQEDNNPARGNEDDADGEGPIEV